MKFNAIAGVALIGLGVVALVYQGITYTTQKTVIDIGALHATADQKETLALPPIFGIVAVGGGVALLLAMSRKRAAGVAVK